MSAVEPGTATSGLVERVKSILLKPSATWDVIDVEPATIGGLYRGYVVPLALIPAVAGLIGSVVFGFGAFGITFKPSILSAVLGAAAGFGATLLGVYLLALIIDGLAPTFGGEKNRIQAFKVAAYAGTATWVVGVFEIYPPLGILGLLGLYSLFLLFKGLPRLMKTPQDKAMPYTIVVIIAALVLGIIVGAIVSPIMRMGGSGLMAGAPATGTVNIGGKSVDLAKLEAASKQVEAAAKQLESGEGPAPTNPDVLKDYLPESIAGYSRTELTTGSGGVAGISGSQAEGAYAKGPITFRLTIVDMGAAGALAGMASAFNVQSSSESDGKYEKVGKVDGRMTQESYDKASKHGEYSVLVGDRFMVAAKGDGASMDELKAATAAVGLARLEALAKAAG